MPRQGFGKHSWPGLWELGMYRVVTILGNGAVPKGRQDRNEISKRFNVFGYRFGRSGTGICFFGLLPAFARITVAGILIRARINRVLHPRHIAILLGIIHALHVRPAANTGRHQTRWHRAIHP